MQTMILCDAEIEALILSPGHVTPYPEPDQIQPASIDVRLGDSFSEFKPRSAHRVLSIDDDMNEHMRSWKSDQVLINPNQFILATTIERVSIPANIVARVEGRSSFGRLGIIVHATAGFIDPGFNGQVTLEMTNIGNHPVRIDKGTRIAQLAFEKMSMPASNPYKGKYQNQIHATPSKIHMDQKSR